MSQRVFAALRACTFAFAALLLAAFLPGSASAAVCNQAASGGTAPSSWQTYCWLDLASYNDASARSGSGQIFSFSLADGSTLTFRLRTSSTATSGATATSAPSWSGAAVGNSAFLGIPGRPILYMNNSGSTVTFTISNISVTPPPGVATVTNYAFVVADAESTDNSESLQYTSNGGGWQLLDSVPPISGTKMPAYSGVGSGTFTESGNGNTGNVGAYIVSSANPTTITARMTGAGLQGIMFAVRFASISLSKRIGGARISASDQFNFGITSTSSGTPLAAGATSGTGLGPFPAVVLSTTSGIPITLSESMASGSSSTLAQYRSVLTCTNATSGSSTVMPNGVVTTSYNFGALNFGDAVSCTFVNTPYPHVTFTKALGAGGRVSNTDQFRLRIRNQTSSTNLNETVTTGTGSTLTIASTGPIQVTAGNLIRVVELASGTTNLARYSAQTSCTNANASSTTSLPAGTGQVDFTPVLGDVITCIITNTKNPATAIISVAKSSTVISDPTGSANPKAIPGAIVEYVITVTNSGDAPVDANSLTMLDITPVQTNYQTSVAVSFTNGATPSGLNTFNAASMVSYSNQTGGAAPYNYTPTGSFDGAVRAIRIAPQGTMAAASGGNNPSFTIRYRMQLR